MGLFSSTKKTTSRDTIPDYVSDQSRYATQRALDINSNPYQAYGGNRVAGLTGLENQGSALARNNVGNYNSYYNRSRNLSRSGSEDFKQSALGKYQNQYQKNVTDPALNRLRDRGAKNIGQINANQHKTSAFGDMVNRSGDARSQLNEGLSDAQAMGNYEGYNYANESYSRDKANDAMLADRYQRMGDTAGALGAQDVNRLMAAGGRERFINQNQEDFDYSQYLEGRDWDQNRLDQLTNTLNGVEYDRTNVTTGSQSGNVLGQALGAGATALGGYLQQPSYAAPGSSQDSPDSNYYQPGGGYDQSTKFGAPSYDVSPPPSAPPPSWASPYEVSPPPGG